MKPRIFIGSSTEGLDVAYSIQNNLDRDAEITVWTQDVFRPSQFILESLIKRFENTDVGIFVFSPDDVTKMRGNEYNVVRDNVVFELGLWMGHLSRHRSFIVAPQDEDLRLPSDLLGINYLTYQANRIDGNFDAALGPTSNKIKRLIAGIELKSESLPPEFKLSLGERRDLLSEKQRDILRFIENTGSVTLNDLAKRFPKMTMAELAYRLEHLRLQMFISAESHKNGQAVQEQTFRPTHVYEKFFVGRRDVSLSPTPTANINVASDENDS
jgi:hypothetical protein